MGIIIRDKTATFYVTAGGGAPVAGPLSENIAWPLNVAGDVAVLIGDPGIAKGVTPASMTGWTTRQASEGAANGNAFNIAAFSSVLAAGHGGNLALTVNGSSLTLDVTAALVLLSGVDNTTPYDTGAAGGSSTTTTSPTAPTITTSRANELLVATFAYKNGSAFTPPAGYTTLCVITGSTSSPAVMSLAICTKLWTSQGSTGTITATIGTTSVYESTHMAFNPVINTPAFWHDFVLSSEVDA